MTTPTPPPTPPQPATSVYPTAPPAPDPTTTPKPTTQRRQLKASRETVIVIALVVATAELALVAALGSWARWLIIHAAIAMIAMIVFLAKFGQNRRRAMAAGAGTRAGRRGLAGLLGGHGTSTGAGRRGLAGLPGTGRGHGLTGLLSGRGRGTGGHGGARGRSISGLLSGGRRHRTGTSGHGAGSGRSGRGRGLGGLFGGTKGGSGRSGRGNDQHGNGTRWGLFGGNDKHGHTKDDGRLGFLARTSKEFKKGWDKAGLKAKNEEEPDTTDDNTESNNTTDEEPAGKETPDTPANPQGGSSKMVKTHGTPSLQAWGRCLPSVEAALLEKQRELRRVEADLENIAEAVVRLHNQGEQELPASPRLVALLADVQASLSKLPRVSEAIGRIASNANALGPLYRTEHTGDEDRLAGMRGGVEREKRSDVGEAQKDT